MLITFCFGVSSNLSQQKSPTAEILRIYFLRTIFRRKYMHKRTCQIRRQDEYFVNSTTMKVWNLVFLVILSIDTSVRDQTRPTLWILVKNWRSEAIFPKISGFLTFIWVIPIKIQEKNCSIFFWPQNCHICIEFQKVVQFWYWQSLTNPNSLSEFRRF